MSQDIFHWARLFSALSILALNVHRECLQDHYLSGQSVTVFRHFHCKELLCIKSLGLKQLLRFIAARPVK